MNASSPEEYYLQVDGKMTKASGVSREGAFKMAQNEAERLHRVVWVYEATGRGYLVLGVCKPAHKYIKWGTFKFSTERPKSAVEAVKSAKKIKSPAGRS